MITIELDKPHITLQEEENFQMLNLISYLCFY